MNKILSLLLAFNVLVGSVGVPVSRHFCGGELKSFAVFGTAKSCHAEKMVSCLSHPEGGSEVKRKSCCSDEFDYTQLDEDRKVEASLELVPTSVLTSALPPRWFAEPPHIARLRKLGDQEVYQPPLLVTDVMRAWQVYLI